jgi:hypothetical protein
VARHAASGRSFHRSSSGRLCYTRPVRLVVGFIVLCGAGAAQAQSRPWARVLEDRDERAAHALIESGIRRIACALEPARCPEGDAPPPDLAFAQAALRFERAREHLPDDPAVLVLTAVSRARALPAEPAPEAIATCIADLEALRALDPGYARAWVAF